MSTDFLTYVNFLKGWKTETDANINEVINEFNLYINLGNYQSDSVVNSEFDKVIKLAKDVRDTTVEADALKIAADVAAVGMIWSFGLSGAAFVAFEAEAIIKEKQISAKSKELNDKLKTLDSDIALHLNSNVSNYIAKFKANNSLIASKTPDGLDATKSRSFLFQFMAQVYQGEGKINPVLFRKYAASVNELSNSKADMDKLCDALDELNLSGMTAEDVEKFINTLVGFNLPSGVELGFVVAQSFSLTMLRNSLKVAESKITDAIKKATETQKTEAATALADLIEKTKASDAAEIAYKDVEARYNAAAEIGPVPADLQLEMINATNEKTDTQIAKTNAKTANETAKNAMKNAEEIGKAGSDTALKTMDAVGKFSAGMAVIISIIDVVFEIFDIIDVVKQSKKMVDELNDTIKKQYIDYFNGLREGAKAYKDSLEPNQK